MYSYTRNIGTSSSNETSSVGQKQSFPTNKSQYHITRVGQKNLCCSKASIIDMLAKTMQFSTPLAPCIGTNDGSLHCPTPIWTLPSSFESQ